MACTSSSKMVGGKGVAAGRGGGEKSVSKKSCGSENFDLNKGLYYGAG